MGNSNIEEVFRVASCKELAETGGGHNQKGVDFQRAWALSRMFELEESGADDFLILFEAVQDVAELDSETAPSSVRVYQVKKKDRGEWEWSHLTRLPAPAKKRRPGKNTDEIKDSPIGKLYSAVLAFKDLKSSGVFLSNTGCNLPLANGDNAATSVSCDLSQLEAEHLDLLKAGLESLHEAGAPPANPELIRVEKVPIHPDAPATHVQGVAVAFLNKRSPRHAGQAKSLVDALLAEVGPLGAKTDTCLNFEELRRQSGYSRGQFAALLSTRHGDMQFSQVVESMGAEKAFRAFEDERVILETEMSDHLLEHERMTEAMSKLTDRNRSKEILKIFREAYSAALVELSLPMTDTGKAKLTSRPNLSGSGGPRSVLAYYAALWAACYGEKGSFRIPLVVDSPNQQGQDHINLPKVISFLSGRLPRGAQLILGSEIDTDIPFDRKIELTEQYKMLSESDFDEAEVTLGPLVSAMYLKA